MTSHDGVKSEIGEILFFLFLLSFLCFWVLGLEGGRTLMKNHDDGGTSPKIFTIFPNFWGPGTSTGGQGTFFRSA